MTEKVRLTSAEIIHSRRTVATENMHNLGVRLPKNLFDPKTGLILPVMLEKIEELVPELTYQLLLDIHVTGARVIVQALPNLLKIDGVQISANTNSWLEEGLQSRSIQITSSKRHFEDLERPPILKASQAEILRREWMLHERLEKDFDGVLIHWVGDELLNKLKHVLIGQEIYLSDFIYLLDSKKLTFKGFYFLSELLGLRSILGNAFNSVINRYRQNGDDANVGYICEEEFAGPLENVRTILAEYDNPQDLIMYILRKIRKDAGRYFPKEQS